MTAARVSSEVFQAATLSLVGLGAVTMIAHAFTGAGFGFHGDELQFMDDARHLAWGYVAYPPMTPFFARLSLDIFGTSIAGFRFFASLAQALAIILTGLMAREMGGGVRAQVLAGAALVPYALGAGAFMVYNSFDNICWILAAWFVIKLLRSGDARWWVAIGAAVGFGMMAKYAMAFFAAAVVAGFLVTDARSYLASRWLWAGCAAALLIWAPNLVWEARHHFVSFDFLRSIHARDVSQGRTQSFVPEQIYQTIAALWVAGLLFCFKADSGKRFRTVGWMYLFLFAAFLMARGRGYYLAAAYPMLYAAGSVWWERRLASKPDRQRRLWRLSWAVVAVAAVIGAVVALPIGPPQWSMWNLREPELRDEVGWEDLVETVARVRDSIPLADRGRLAVLTGHYGAAGAIDLYRDRYGLPAAISRINSYEERGYGDPPPETVIAIGIPREFLESRFASCRPAAQIRNRYGVVNRSYLQGVFVCRGLNEGWPRFWAELPRFG
ncbi:MAG: glycosyltransferase family 39 protein [Bryobacteraceae bacterium]